MGADWADSITKAIRNCKLMVLIFSGNANSSQRVLDELNYAISRGKPILPFRVESLEPTGAMELHLSSRHWLDAFDPSWQSHIDRLVSSVRANLEVGSQQKITIKGNQSKKDEVPIKNRTSMKKWLAFALIGILIVGVLGWLGWRIFGPGIVNDMSNPSPTELSQKTEKETLTADYMTPNEVTEITLSVQETAMPEPTNPPLKIGLIASFPHKGFQKQNNNDIWAGMEKAQEELGAEIDRVEIQSPDQCQEHIEKFVEDGFDLILTSDPKLNDATLNAARDYPQVNFIGVHHFRVTRQENYVSLLYETDKLGFLAGSIAGMITNTGQVAAVFGPEFLDTIVAVKVGFKSGVIYIDKTNQANSIFHPGNIEQAFDDPEWGTDIAKQEIEKGSDVIFEYADNTGKSALVETARQGKMCIGSEIDVWETRTEARPCLVTTILYDKSNDIFNLIEMAYADNFPSGVFYGNIKLGDFHQFTELPSEIIEEFEKTQQEIDSVHQKLLDDNIDTGYSGDYGITWDTIGKEQ